MPNKNPLRSATPALSLEKLPPPPETLPEDATREQVIEALGVQAVSIASRRTLARRLAIRAWMQQRFCRDGIRGFLRDHKLYLEGDALLDESQGFEPKALEHPEHFTVEGLRHIYNERAQEHTKAMTGAHEAAVRAHEYGNVTREQVTDFVEALYTEPLAESTTGAGSVYLHWTQDGPQPTREQCNELAQALKVFVAEWLSADGRTPIAVDPVSASVNFETRLT